MSNEQNPSTTNTATRRMTRNRAAGLGLLAALSLTAAACGGTAGVSSETTTVEIGSGGSSDDGAEAELGQDGLPSLGAEEEADSAGDDAMADEEMAPNEEAAVEEFIACMTEEGIDAAELDAASPAEQEALTSTPEFLAAQEICEPILADAFGSFDLNPEIEAALADRSAEMAACGREVLGIEIPDNVLLLPEDDPKMIEIENLETTPEQDAAIEQCLEDILGDILDDEGNLVAPGEGE